MNPVPVIGRFAPSPTGDLHFGSLVSAVGSYLEAKCVGGAWLLRIEDIDPPREIAGSANRIIDDLNKLGLVPDGPVLYQSSRSAAYQAVVEQLLSSGLAYPCGCSRKDLSDSGRYAGTCRNGIAPGKKPRSIRFRVDDDDFTFYDRLQGMVSDSPADASGDFIIRRADGLFAYQLAVAVDDHFQGITQVVRGADLLESTSRQICLQKALGYVTPEYMHLPVAVFPDGKKMSKRTRTDPVTDQEPVTAVRMALQFLGQHPPAGMSLKDLWAWAIQHWDNKLVPPARAILPGSKLS
ncbi:MAG: tRNA glutamyl-Q(34) synthetase GluQRS [Lysobacterales bacterium]